MSENSSYKNARCPAPGQGIHPALAFSTSSSAGHQELEEAHELERKRRGEASNGVRVPLQRLRQQQGEEAAAQAGAAQAADRQDPFWQPCCAGRQEQGAQLWEISKAGALEQCLQLQRQRQLSEDMHPVALDIAIVQSEEFLFSL
ncbi:hypothetical protein SETIT_5G371800v2 [Setaria italica]|uniref:Uncharacterized protein n=1 Tax=Setaria italica TaxID=4555 RepID=A0A368RCU8_SETIT|nr:hypothetical protein SETIT_5G371800v2 [Setaria italica]